MPRANFHSKKCRFLRSTKKSKASQRAKKAEARPAKGQKGLISFRPSASASSSASGISAAPPRPARSAAVAWRGTSAAFDFSAAPPAAQPRRFARRQKEKVSANGCHFLIDVEKITHLRPCVQQRTSAATESGSRGGDGDGGGEWERRRGRHRGTW